MRFLVTGFDAFGGRAFNPAEAIVRGLVGEKPPTGVEAVTGLVLPTAFADATALTVAAIERERPDAVVMFGLAADTDAIRLESVARNACNTALRDNTGTPGTATIIDGGPVTYGCGLELDELVARLAGAGVEARVSDDAGAYVCNHLYYGVLAHLAARDPATPALFVHVPWAHPVRTAADFAEAPLAAHRRRARLVIAGVARLIAERGTSVGNCRPRPRNG